MEPYIQPYIQPYILWFAAAGALIAVELVTGTVFLLMIAAGAAVAALIALGGVGMVGQFICATLVSVAGCAVLRMRGIGIKPSGEKTNLAFDAGQAVEVIERRANGTLRVNYRGTQWDAALEAGAGDGPYVIRQMRGSVLVLGARA